MDINVREAAVAEMQTMKSAAAQTGHPSSCDFSENARGPIISQNALRE